MSNPGRANQILARSIILLFFPAMTAYFYYTNQLPASLAKYGWNIVWIAPAFVVLVGRVVSRIGMLFAKLIIKFKSKQSG